MALDHRPHQQQPQSDSVDIGIRLVIQAMEGLEQLGLLLHGNAGPWSREATRQWRSSSSTRHSTSAPRG